MKIFPTIDLVKYVGQDRFFVDLWMNCPSKCSYCYIPDTKPSIKDEIKRIEHCKDVLFSHPDFKKGKNGSLISLSPHAEPFSSVSRSKAIFRLIQEISIFDNPIQLATKAKLDRWHIKHLNKIRKYDTQILAFISIATISNNSQYEWGTSQPKERFENIRLLDNDSIPSCLFIKPVLPQITILDIDLFVELCLKYEVKVTCVGVLYANIKVLSKMTFLNGLPKTEDLKPPGAKPNEYFHINNDQEINMIYDRLKNETNSQVFKSAPCVIAWYFNTYSPTLTWKRFPQLCVHCKDCEQLYLTNNI